VSSNVTKTGSTAGLHQKFNPEAPEGEVETGGESEHPDAGLLTHPSYLELQKKLVETEDKANQYWERLLRMQAESDNLSRRVERDVANAHKFALEKFVLELLPVVDSMERSLLTTVDAESSAAAILEGISLTLKMFYDVLEKFGVQQINPESEPFNPEFHQGVSVQINNSVKSGTVLNVLQKGYLLNGRLIRPAFVVVSKTD
jgi:molecular chaperone GrpE